MMRTSIKDIKLTKLTKDMTLETSQQCVPTCLYNLLAWIIHEDDSFEQKLTLVEMVTVPDDIHCVIFSIAQDIVYAARHGRVQTPKHVSLAVSVHHIIGGIQLVDLLHSFGHCISKSRLQEVETAIASERLADDSGDLVPSNIVPNAPTVFVWDNNDFNEETSTGKGTTHCTNGIVIQPATAYCCLMKSKTSLKKKTHQRTIHAEVNHFNSTIIATYSYLVEACWHYTKV